MKSFILHGTEYRSIAGKWYQAPVKLTPTSYQAWQLCPTLAQYSVEYLYQAREQTTAVALHIE